MQLLKTLKRKFGISAPRVAVRTHISWYLRWLGIVAAGGLIFGAGWATYDFGMEFAGFRRGESDRALAELKGTIETQRRELSELHSRVARAEQRRSNARLGRSGKTGKILAGENATLKEDLAFFQSPMPASGKDGAITITVSGCSRKRCPASIVTGCCRCRPDSAQRSFRAAPRSS